MERGSTQHSAELDDQLKKEIEPIERGSPGSPRVEEHRMSEDTDREPGGILDRDQAQARSLIARQLDRVVFSPEPVRNCSPMPSRTTHRPPS